MDVYDFSPLSDRLGLTPKLNSVVKSAVIEVALPRYPSAIFWAVWAVIIDPVDIETLRSHSHVGDEVRKLPPALANSDAPAAVVAVMKAVCVFTSLKQLLPNPIDG